MYLYLNKLELQPMTKIIIDIPDVRDLHALLPLLQRLGLAHSITEEGESVLMAREREELYQIIEAGAPSADFEEFQKDFEESRQDRPQPGREQ
jgi:hypothetical protein